MSSLNLDAEALYADMLAGVRGLMRPDSVLVGVWSGGASSREVHFRSLDSGRPREGSSQESFYWGGSIRPNVPCVSSRGPAAK